jgi:hypothetical protein
MSNDQGHVTRACVVAIDTERDIVLLASMVGRSSPMPIRSLILTWVLERANTIAERQHLCQSQGCHEVAFVQMRLESGLRYICHRHIPTNAGVIFPGDPESALPNVPISAVATPETLPETVLSECPNCHSQDGIADHNRSCSRCGARWRAIAQTVTLDRLASYVADARRLMRRDGRDASHIQMAENVGRIVVMDTNAVPLRNADNEEILISRGTGRGHGPVFAGLPVQYTVDGPVVVVSIAERVADPVGTPYIRTTDMVGFVHVGMDRGGDYLLDRMGHQANTARLTITPEHFATGFAPMSASMPPVGSFWRNPQVDGSFVTVTGHAQAAGAVLHVVFTNEHGANEALPLRAFTQRHVRFDQIEPPAVGSRWVSRASLDPIAVTEVNVVEGMTYVVVRNAMSNIFRMLLPDLWRNYTSVSEEGEFTCELGEEWVDQHGVSHKVILLDRELGIATLTAPDGTRTQHTPKSLLTWRRIERLDVYERLAGEDLFGSES